MASPHDLLNPTPTGPGSNGSFPMDRKRKDSMNEHDSGRAVKHRSSQACQSCRARKVRCDVIVNGSRCTNCRLDNTECIVVASKRGKNNHSHRNSVGQTEPSQPPQLAKERSHSTSNPNGRNTWPSHEALPSHVVPTDASHVPACVTFDEESDKPRSEKRPSISDAIRRGSNPTPSTTYDGVLSPGSATNPPNQYLTSAGYTTLPPFITPLSDHILREDLDFLSQKGAFKVPEPDLALDVLRGYMSSVHPFMPMLDYKAFIYAVTNNGEQGDISLILFQAVMFAGVNTLQLPTIQRLGFQSVKQARQVLFDRVRLLYEFDVERDNAALLQAIILMSQWYGKWDERRHTWHWTGLAYDIARNMGLHRDPAAKSTSDKVRGFRRRLWWSLYIRDRLIALGTRRPMRILDEDFQVSMLTLEDFDLEQMIGNERVRSLVPSVDDSTSTASMCIQLAKLCTIIGHVTSSQYTVLSSQPDLPHTMMVVSRRDGECTEELERCDKELEEWRQALSSNIRRASLPVNQEGDYSCSEVHWAILNVTYLTVVNVLHRAKALQPPSDTAGGKIVQNSSRSKVKEAARSLTKISQTMLRNDQVRFFGPIGVTALVAACLSHMLDTSSGDEDIRDASTFRLYQSLQVLQALTSIYASADAGVSFLESIIQKAGITLPTRLATSSTHPLTTPSEGLGTPSLDEKQSIFWKRSTDSMHGGWGSTNDHPESSSSGWHTSPPALHTQPTMNQPQSQYTNRNGQLPMSGSLMRQNSAQGTISPSAVAFATSSNATPSNHRASDMLRPADSTFGGFSNPNADGVFTDWNNATVSGFDFEHMAYTYDIYSDAFGFSNNQLQGI